MTLSGTTVYNDTFIECLTDALVLIGGLEDNESASNTQELQCVRWGNRLLKSWQKKGFKVWLIKEGELALSKGQNTYTLGTGGDYTIDRPLDISNIRRYIRSDDNEVPIKLSSRNEYMEQTSKDVKGKPVLAYYDAQLTLGKIYLWPTPDDSQDEIRFSYRTPIQDLGASANNIDIPQEWLLAFTYNLALLLCPQYEVNLQDRAWIREEAMRYLEEAEIGDDDESSVFFTARKYS